MRFDDEESWGPSTKKTQSWEGFPKTAESRSLLDDQLQSELDVRTLVTRLASPAKDATLLGLAKMSALRVDIEDSAETSWSWWFENIVELSAERQEETWGELEAP